MSERILCTGGAGLVGSACVRELNRQGHTDILIVDKLGSSPHKWRTLSQLRFADYVEWDDFSANSYARAGKWIDGVTTVLHLGARSHTTEQDAAFLMRNNFEASQELGDWCEREGARFVYASSAATYGADTSMDDTGDLRYLETLRPLNPYSFSKHLFDLWMTRNGAFDPSGILNRGGGAVGLKYTNVFAPPWEHHKGNQRSVVAKAYDSLKAGQPITLFESARKDVKTEEIRRDFLSADDAARITVWFALDGKGRKASGLYNVGSGQSTSFTDLARFTAEAFVAEHGAPVPSPDYVYNEQTGEMKRVWPENLAFPYIDYAPMPEELRRRYQYHTNPPIAKLRAAGYAEPITPLKDAIRDYVGILAREEVR